MTDLLLSPGLWMVVAGLLLPVCRAETRWVLILGAPLVALGVIIASTVLNAT